MSIYNGLFQGILKTTRKNTLVYKGFKQVLFMIQYLSYYYLGLDIKIMVVGDFFFLYILKIYFKPSQGKLK